MESDKKICRLCLETCSGNFEGIKETHQENLNLISLNLNLAVTYQPIVCTKCGETLQKCSDFKMACLLVEDSVVSFAERQNNREGDLRKFYRGTVLDGCNVCRFCLKVTKHGHFVFLNEEQLDILLTNAMLQQYFSEMDLNATKEPVVCMQCYESLQSYFSFVINCLTVENKINKYCETEGTIFKGFVKLSRVVYFTLYDVLENKDKPSGLNTIEAEGGWCEKGDSKTEDMWFDGVDNSKKFEVKDEKITEGDEFHEVVNSCAYIEIKSENIVKDNEQLEETEGIYIEANIKNENVTEVEHTSINSDIKHEDNQTNKQEFSDNCNKTKEMNNDSFCGCMSLLLPKEDLQEVTSSTGHTGNCISEGIPNDNEQYSIPYHTSETSSSQPEHEKDNQNSLSPSKSIPEVSTYKCETCRYQFKHKVSLQRHMLNHKSSSEVTIHKCTLCPYQSRHKDFIRKHMVVHRSVTEVNAFKCAICDCQFKRKAYLQRHMVEHKNISEITMYKCERCSYRSKHKNDFQQHVLVHKNFSEVTTYKCRICTYQSKRNCNLQRHMLNHRRASEVTMLKCKVCLYQTRHKGNLQKHMLIHEEISKVRAFNCEICECQFKSKIGLQRHMNCCF